MCLMREQRRRDPQSCLQSQAIGDVKQLRPEREGRCTSGVQDSCVDCKPRCGRSPEHAKYGFGLSLAGGR